MSTQLNSTQLNLKPFYSCLSILLLFFSCTFEQTDIIPVEDSLEVNEVQIAPDGYLIFETWDTFKKYLKLSASELPEQFVSLNKNIRNLKERYAETNDINILKGYYKEERNQIVPEYRFMAFSSVLDLNKIVEVEGKLLKMDFDNLKESVDHNYQNLTNNQNFTIVPSQNKFLFNQPVTRSTVCMGYMQLSKIYDIVFGFCVADDNNNPDPVIGTFRASGGNLHYGSTSNSFGSFLKSFNSTSNPHSYLAGTIDIPCEDVYVTFVLYSGRIEFTSVGDDVNCDFDANFGTLGSSYDGCH